MKEKPMINIRAIQCQPEFDEKFNKWYEEVHIPMLFKSKEVKEVTRYKLIDGTEEDPKYLTIYKFDSLSDFEAFDTGPERAAAREEMRETWPEGGFESKWRLRYEVMKTWKR